MEFWRYVAIVRRRWWVPVVLALLAVTTAAGLLAYRTYWVPTYASTATLMVRTPAASNSVLVYSSPAGGFGVTDYVTLIKTDIVAIMSSPAFVQRVAQRFPNRMMPGSYAATAVPNTSLINITAKATSPQTAHQLAATATNAFLTFYRDLNRSDAAESRAFLGRQVADARGQLEAADRRLQEYRASKGLPALDEQIGRMVSTLAQFHTERELAGVSARQAVARIAAARRAIVSQTPTQVSAETLVESPTLQQLRARLTGLEVELNAAAQVYTDAHPKMFTLRGEIATLRARVQQEAERVVGTRTISTNPLHQRLAEETVIQMVEYTAAIARQDALSAAAQRLQMQMPTLTTAQRDLAGLLREQKAAEGTYLLLSAKLNEAVLKEQQAAYETVSVRLVNAPLVPAQPVPLPRGLMLVAALTLGMALGIGAAFVVEYLDGAVRTSAEAVRVFGLDVLGVIPTINRRVFRHLTTPPRPAWQTVTFVFILAVAVAAMGMLGARIGVAQDIVTLWGTIRATF